jgi:hypothetical protein
MGEKAMSDTLVPVCSQCADVIGVYESVVLVTVSGAIERSSRAADPEILARGHVYHQACFQVDASHEIVESVISREPAAGLPGG